MSEARFTDEQREVIESWGEGLAVFAGAGCGKTTTLVGKCQRLLARDPEARFIAVSFTERSANDIRLKLAEKVDLSRHLVTTIDGFFASVLREFPEEAEVEGDEKVLAALEADALWERVFDAFLLDRSLPPDLTGALDRLTQALSVEELYTLTRETRALVELAERKVNESGLANDCARLTEALERRYRQLKRARGVLDFTDLGRGADRALAHTRVREHYRTRYALVLVDEFQDTNALQARVLKAAVRPDLSNWCVVGDPKQSIYRFRGADVSVFEQVCAELPKRLRLTRNFRSTPEILDFVNRACEPLFPEGRYDALVSGREQNERSPQAVSAFEDADPAAFAEWLRQSPIDLGRTALLVRNLRGKGVEWIRALEQARVPVGIMSSSFFWENPVVREAVSLLRWWDEPEATLSAATFLRAPWVDVSHAVLDGWFRDRTREAQAEALTSFLALDHPVARALRPYHSSAREANVRAGTLLEAILSDASLSDQVGAPLLGLWHRAEGLSAAGLDFRESVRDFVMRLERAEREGEVPPPSDEGLLQVMTVHASKGLEFDHVILLDFPIRAKTRRFPKVFWDRGEGLFIPPRDDAGRALDEKESPEVALWRAREERRALEESRRVLYVALTRAKRRLVLVKPAAEDEKAQAKFSVDLGEFEADPHSFLKDHWRVWIERASRELPQASLLSGELNSPDARTAPGRAGESAPGESERSITPEKSASALRVRSRHAVTEWLTAERSELEYLNRVWGQAPPERELPAVEGEAISAMELGTRVHAALEWMEWGELAGVLPPARLAELRQWAETTPLFQAADEDRSEFSFEVPLVAPGEQTLVGTIDRLIVRQDRLTLLDFKVLSSELGRSAEELRARYQFQLELYAWAIRRLGWRGEIEAKLVAFTIARSGVPELVDVPLREERTRTWVTQWLARLTELGSQA